MSLDFGQSGAGQGHNRIWASACAVDTLGPIERTCDPAQPSIVLVPWTVQVAPHDYHRSRPGAGCLESRGRALRAGPGCPRVVDEKDRLAVQGPDAVYFSGQST